MNVRLLDQLGSIAFSFGKEEGGGGKLKIHVVMSGKFSCTESWKNSTELICNVEIICSVK